MDIGTHYRYLDNIDPTPVLDVLQSYSSAKWEENTIRQDIHYVHKDTKSIVLRFCKEDSLDFKHYKRDYPELDIIQPTLDHISSFYGKGGFIRIVFAYLPAHEAVLRHIDAGKIYTYVHRIHWVIDTNEDVMFTMAAPVVGAKDERIPFNNGDIVEINNRWFHEVQNNSDRDRIHLIADYVTDTDRVKFHRL